MTNNHFKSTKPTDVDLERDSGIGQSEGLNRCAELMISRVKTPMKVMLAMKPIVSAVWILTTSAGRTSSWRRYYAR
jgi:hypothetical protein